MFGCVLEDKYKLEKVLKLILKILVFCNKFSMITTVISFNKQTKAMVFDYIKICLKQNYMTKLFSV